MVMQLTHHAVGYTVLAIGAFFGVIAVIWWGRDQLEKARDRQARREFDATVAQMPVHDGDTYEWGYDDYGQPLPYYEPVPGYEFEPPTRVDEPQYDYLAALRSARNQRLGDYWPAEGQATRHFFGTDIVRYDPEADAAEFIRRMKADTDSFIAAKITRELERVPA